jgi:XTP/dITP diphosphohydrolase
VCRGEVHGRIVDAPRGAGGFGYDPYFLSTELGRTFGEVSGDEKSRVSHRARAFRALIEQLRDR